jgi:hypothetical protein
MKAILSIARRSVSALFAALTFTMVFGAATTAQAQLRPFVDCVERVDNQNYRAYFGYVSLYHATVSYSIDSPDNYFTPITDPPGQPRDFLPGIHRRVVSVIVPNDRNETWVLEQNFTEATAQTVLSCTDAGNNSHTITYQGRLTDGGTAANGQYDLRFQLFDAITNGASQSAALELDSVSVAGGVFTVQLDFGLLPAFLEGGNLFLQIGVRPGAATGSAEYTTLSPRQPLTAAPYAIRAQSAANADSLNGLSANQFLAAADTQIVRTNDSRLSDARTPIAGSSNYIQNTTTQQADANFSISGNGTVGGTLAANIINASSESDTVLRGTSSSTVGARLALQNTTTGGTTWNLISTGSGNGEGAGKLVFFNEGSNTAPLQLNGSGANVTGNLTVSGAINGTASNATNATNAAQLGGVAASNFVQTTDARLSDARTPTAGSTNYIQNTTTQQPANFNVSGSGTVGGTLNASVINSTTQYNIGGSRVLGIAGSNLFAGINSGGANTSGAGNVFVGTNAGAANTTGNANVALGDNATFGTGNLTNATAIGAGAVVANSNTILLGRASGLDSVLAPGGIYLGNSRLHLLDASDVNNQIGYDSSINGLVFSAGDAFQWFSARNNRVNMQLDSGGSLRIVGSYLQFSDARYKINVQTFAGALAAITRLRGVTFNWNPELNKSPNTQIGFIAQEVEAVLPEIVSTDKEGYKSVAYSNAVPVLVEAIKEQQTQIERQQKQITQQQLLIDGLKKIVCQQTPTADVCQ